MRHVLARHPDSPCSAPIRIEGEAGRSGSGVLLDFRVSGDNRNLLLPDPAAPGFRDGLWQHSCFEAFIRPDQGDFYCELNLSPSGEWAAYAFDSYREGMRPVDPLPALAIALARSDTSIELRAQVELNGVKALASGHSWRLGLSAVIEDVHGHKSYWALAHPPGAPDFHHKDCFALELPPPG